MGEKEWRVDAVAVRGKPPIEILGKSVGIVEEEEAWRGMESGCCASERMTT